MSKLINLKKKKGKKHTIKSVNSKKKKEKKRTIKYVNSKKKKGKKKRKNRTQKGGGGQESAGEMPPVVADTLPVATGTLPVANSVREMNSSEAATINEGSFAVAESKPAGNNNTAVAAGNAGNKTIAVKKNESTNEGNLKVPPSQNTNEKKESTNVGNLEGNASKNITQKKFSARAAAAAALNMTAPRAAAKKQAKKAREAMAGAPASLKKYANRAASKAFNITAKYKLHRGNKFLARAEELKKIAADKKAAKAEAKKAKAEANKAAKAAKKAASKGKSIFGRKSIFGSKKKPEQAEGEQAQGEQAQGEQSQGEQVQELPKVQELELLNSEGNPMPKVEELELLNPVNMINPQPSPSPASDDGSQNSEESVPASAPASGSPPEPVPPPEKGIIMFTMNGNCPPSYKEHEATGTCYKKLKQDEIDKLKNKNKMEITP